MFSGIRAYFAGSVKNSVGNMFSFNLEALGKSLVGETRPVLENALRTAQGFLANADNRTLPELEDLVGALTSLVNSPFDDNNYDTLQSEVCKLQTANPGTDEKFENQIIALYQHFDNKYKRKAGDCESANHSYLENGFTQDCKKKLKDLLETIYEEKIEKNFTGGEKGSEKQRSLKNDVGLRKSVAHVIAGCKISRKSYEAELNKHGITIADEELRTLKQKFLQAEQSSDQSAVAGKSDSSSNIEYDSFEDARDSIDPNVEKFERILLYVLEYIKKQKCPQDGIAKIKQTLSAIEGASEKIGKACDTITEHIPQITKATVEAASGTPYVFAELESATNELIDLISVDTNPFDSATDNVVGSNVDSSSEICGIKKAEILARFEKIQKGIYLLHHQEEVKKNASEFIEYKYQLKTLNDQITSIIGKLKSEEVRGFTRDEVIALIKQRMIIVHTYYDRTIHLTDTTTKAIADCQNAAKDASKLMRNYSVKPMAGKIAVIVASNIAAIVASYLVSQIIKSGSKFDIGNLNAIVVAGLLFASGAALFFWIGPQILATKRTLDSDSNKKEDIANYAVGALTLISGMTFLGAFVLCIARFANQPTEQFFKIISNEELCIWIGVTLFLASVLVYGLVCLFEHFKDRYKDERDSPESSITNADPALVSDNPALVNEE